MKKTFWENRLIAWVVLAACVLFSLVFSGSRALFNLREDTEQVFYQGVNNDGLSIQRDIEERVNCAYNLASIASGYASIDRATVQNAREASNQLAAATDIAGKFEANQLCQHAVEDLYTAMENTALSESDRSYAYRQYKEFQSRADTISRDFYNDRARQFNRELSAFPAAIIGGMTGVTPLKLFGQK